MSNIFNNSIWPNGLQDATEGYPVFYPLGTNKVEIPDGVTTMWPDGDKLIGDFVYKNDKVVGFIDTKALIASSSGNTTMNYSYIDINLPSIYEDELTVNAPNATFKKITWAVRTDDNVIVTLKYKGCKTLDDVKTIDPDYQTTDIVDGVWSEGLGDLEQGGEGWWNGGMFSNCSNLTSFNSDLSSLTDGNCMFLNCSNLTSFNVDLPSLKKGYCMFYNTKLESFPSDLSSLTVGEWMFGYCYNLESFTSDLSSLTEGYEMFYNCTALTSFTSDLSSMTIGYEMFDGCSALTSFTSDLSSMTNGRYMFRNCSSLTSFTSNLSSLTYGLYMFRYCSNLESFTSDLSSLTEGDRMFDGCSALTSFSSDLSSLTDGGGMFVYCTNLESFTSDLSSLTNGHSMFYGCSNLTSFSSDLSSLENGLWMFEGCKLDAPSVKNIIETKNPLSGILTLGIGCNNTTEDADLFAQEVGYADMNSLKAASSGIHAQYNGRPTTTYGLRRPSENTLPVFVKLEEVEETEEYANYTSLDDSKKFRLGWFHETTGSTEGYTQFNSLEEAVEHFNVKPVERNR